MIRQLEGTVAESDMQRAQLKHVETNNYMGNQHLSTMDRTT